MSKNGGVASLQVRVATRMRNATVIKDQLKIMGYTFLTDIYRPSKI